MSEIKVYECDMCGRVLLKHATPTRLGPISILVEHRLQALGILETLKAADFCNWACRDELLACAEITARFVPK